MVRAMKVISVIQGRHGWIVVIFLPTETFVTGYFPGREVITRFVLIHFLAGCATFAPFQERNILKRDCFHTGCHSLG